MLLSKQLCEGLCAVMGRQRHLLRYSFHSIVDLQESPLRCEPSYLLSPHIHVIQPNRMPLGCGVWHLLRVQTLTVTCGTCGVL